MRIGIDIDGVLTNVSRFQLDYGSMFFNKRVVNPNAFESTLVEYFIIV